MRTIIYVDGFNLYFRLLHTRPHLKWLNIKALAQNVLGAQHWIIGVRYYTARVSGRTDPTAPARQQVYLDALGTIPEISVHLGSFLSSKKFAGLVYPPEFRPRLASPIPQPWPVVVRVHKTEEKGSDVNLASHLLLGAFRNEYDVAAIVSNDTDLVEPLRIVTNELGKVVTLLSPVPNPAPQLKAVAALCSTHQGRPSFRISIRRSTGSCEWNPALETYHLGVIATSLPLIFCARGAVKGARSASLPPLGQNQQRQR